MKRIIFAICTILCANVLSAQEQLATLKHNDSISVYYGANAFVQAYNAAANGDIITLSDGMFYAPDNMRKGITVRGNGACADTTRHSAGTYFTQSFNLFDLDSLQFSAEGIYFNEFDGGGSYNIKLNKCYVGGIRRAYGLQATNCIITIEDQVSSYSHSNIYINCILTSASGYIPHSYSTCYNCIMIGGEYDAGAGNQISNPYQYNNCIIIKDSTSTDVILDYPVNNSVLIGFTGTLSLASSGNVVMSLSDVFENWDGESFPTDLETYVLKSSVSNSILGLDGREVGIFGGAIPFDWTPTYSVIKRLDVPNTPDENGMLNIDVEFLTE